MLLDIILLLKPVRLSYFSLGDKQTDVFCFNLSHHLENSIFFFIHNETLTSKMNTGISINGKLFINILKTDKYA